jgi:oligopeptide/dipeptide ABC transporter ATP-binding protein
MPRIGERRARLAAIEGMVPDLRRPIEGCRFQPRCPFAIARCGTEVPALASLAPGHLAACLRAPLDQVLAA